MSLPEIQLKETFAEQEVNPKTVFRASAGGIAELTKALCAARKNFGAIKKNAENPFYKDAKGKPRTYADLSEMIAATAEPLAEQGLYVIQAPMIQDRMVGVTTLLSHTSGQWIEFALFGLPAEQRTKDGITFDAQKQGIGFTYAARYSYRALLSLGTEDDDGNGLVSQPEQKKPLAFGLTGPAPKPPNPPDLSKITKTALSSPESELKITAKDIQPDDGCPISDEDLPDNIKSVKPTASELKGYADRLKALKQDNRLLKNWFEAESKTPWSETSKDVFEKITTLAEQLNKDGKLGELLKQ